MEYNTAPKQVLRDNAKPDTLSGSFELIPDKSVEGAWLFLQHDLFIAALVYTEAHPIGPNLEEVDYQEAQAKR